MAITFSVVVPLYNKAPHILETLRSVYGQTYKPEEVIVVDDGSTDGSSAIVSRASLDNLRLLQRSPPSPGGYAARNLGVEEAVSEWVAFLDADDVWYPNHLQSLKDAITRSGEDVVCAFSRLMIKEGDSLRDYPFDKELLSRGQSVYLDDLVQAWLNTKRCPLWTGAVAIRKSVLLQSGLFPAGRATRGGDKDLWLRVISKGKVAFAREVTCEFVQDSVNRVSNSSGFVEPPILVETISALIAGESYKYSSLLRKLSNQELELYAKYSLGRASIPPIKWIKLIYYPEGIKSAAWILSIIAAGRLLALLKAVGIR